MSKDILSKVFENLDEWRHLPDYQLERRIDIFFTAYLPLILGSMVNDKLQERIIPEFPLRDDENPNVKKKKDGSFASLTSKVDYLLCSEDKKTVYLVELKTDNNSLNEKQIRLMRDAKCKVKIFNNYIDRLKDVAIDSDSKRKYFHLFFHLELLQLIEIHNKKEIIKIFGKKDNRGINQYIDENIKVLGKPKIEVVFIQPKPSPMTDEFECIYFSDIAKQLRKPNLDGKNSLFADCLEKWVDTAGDQQPFS